MRHVFRPQQGRQGSRGLRPRGSLAPAVRARFNASVIRSFVRGLPLLLASGCATLSSAVSDRARGDLGCDDVSVSDQGSGEYVASGCGASASYTCLYGDTDELGAGPKTPVCIREGNLDVQPVVVESPAPKSAAPAAASSSPVHRRFPVNAAIATMRLAASFAEDCSAVEGPRGSGKADVVFATDGHVASVTLSAPFQGTPVGECVASKFRRVVLPPFTRGPKTTHKTFEVPALPTAPASASASVAPPPTTR